MCVWCVTRVSNTNSCCSGTVWCILKTVHSCATSVGPRSRLGPTCTITTRSMLKRNASVVNTVTQSDLSSRTRRRRKVPQRSSDSPSHSSITNHQANVLLKTGLKVPSKARNLKPFSKRKESLGMKMMMKGAGKNQKQKTQSTSKALAIRIQKTTAMKTILIKYFFIFPKIFSKIFYD